jgi:23S rRNA (uracil1939-C5)-methyltransferase
MSRRRKKQDPNEYEAIIETLSHEGRGIAHLNEKPVFIFNALPDEKVKFRYTQKKQKICEGATTEVLTNSPDRITAKCPHFTLCGGCSLQHMTPGYQQDFKRQSVLQLLKQQNVTPQTVTDTLTGPTWGYRRKARLGAKFLAPKDTILLGFRERGSSFLAHLDQCEILDPRIGHLFPAIKTWLYSLDARDTIPQIELAATNQAVALIIRHMEPLSSSDIEKIKTFAQAHQFKIFLQPKGIDSIHPLNTEEKHLTYQLPAFDLEFKFQPFQFTQINETINQKMTLQAIDWLDLKPNDQVLDLFCGIGNFTLPLATKSGHVVGVEADTTAVEQAKQNADHNQLPNTEFYVANLFDDCSIFPWAKRQYNKVVLDPPRSGAEAILNHIPHWQPTHILYISCNPATFARDAAKLSALGYQLEKFCTMDMFPHTQHTEVMGLFKPA